MKISKIYLLVLTISLLSFPGVFAQQAGLLYTIAGNGTMSFTGDGGLATVAGIDVWSVNTDAAGNIYFADMDHDRIRKINTSGIITTIAGNGTMGYNGDGIPAITATLTQPAAVIPDNAGNVYIGDVNNYRIRKVNTSGIISTIAGTGIYGYSGDGGQATAAQIGSPEDIVIDHSGNIIFIDINCIRKISTTGIISTIGGSGYSSGYYGDGGAATNATLNTPMALAIDESGNIYIADAHNNVIRKINTAGIISTIAGNGTAGYSGDNNAATNAMLSSPDGVAVDKAGNVFITDNFRIRKIARSGIISTVAGNGSSTYAGENVWSAGTSIAVSGKFCLDHSGNFLLNELSGRIRKIALGQKSLGDNFSVFQDKLCSGVSYQIYTNSYTSSLQVKTYYGDGQSSTSPLSIDYFGKGYYSGQHIYDFAGTYTVKHVLFSGTSAIDSMSYVFTNYQCSTLPLRFYYDGNGNCIKDGSTEPYMNTPVTLQVDSNGIIIDTISVTSGIDFDARGNLGDIYKFKVVSLSPDLLITCPASGIIIDTLVPHQYNTQVNNIGLKCNTIAAFDLSIHATAFAGRHLSNGNINIANNYCTPENAIVKLSFSPKYAFESSYPIPSSITGNMVSWDINSLSVDNLFPKEIRYSLTVPGAWLMNGDTVQSSYMINPFVGDTDTSNNVEVHTDTVKGSYDPNYVEVRPAGLIPSGHKLEYTIGFENTGRDTAVNIYILDTLSDNVDPMSMKILTTPATMNISKIQGAGHTILKFDFPGINLPDSSHHNQCNGMVAFTINAKNGLANGTTILNHAGIFFDYNPVVLTNTVTNVICNACILGIKTSETTNTEIYPNPANEYLTVSTSPAAYNSITITNQLGQSMLQQVLANDISKIDIKSLAPGLYFITLKGENGTKVMKFVKS